MQRERLYCRGLAGRAGYKNHRDVMMASATLTTVKMNQTCNLYDGARNYRLGDVTGSRFFRHTAGGLHYHLKNFPGSLAAAFLNTYGHGKPAYRAYYNASCNAACVKSGYCQCYVPRAHALHDFLSREPTPPLLEATAAVHLRVGDVVDQSPYSIDDMLTRPTHFKTRCTRAQESRGCLSIHDRVYVQPLDRYASVVERFRAMGIRRVVVVAASSVDQAITTASAAGIAFSHAKSCEYVRRMGRYMSEAGFATEYRLGGRPDDDFRFLTRRVRCLVGSASGFAGLAGQVAQKFGATVLMPDGITLPTFDLTG